MIFFFPFYIGTTTIFVVASRAEEVPIENCHAQEETIRVEILKPVLIQLSAEIRRNLIRLHFWVLKMNPSPPEVRFFLKNAPAFSEIIPLIKMYKV